MAVQLPDRKSSFTICATTLGSTKPNAFLFGVSKYNRFVGAWHQPWHVTFSVWSCAAATFT